jgi:ribonuclease J
LPFQAHEVGYRTQPENEQMTNITVYGGADHIGGNKILLEDRDTRIFLDFGEQFNFKDDFFADWLKPRDARTGLKDYFHFDLMPKIPGLYGKRWLAHTDLKYEKPAFDAIFISHMHFDHAMHLKFVDDDVPVYLGAAADTIRKSWETTGGTSVSFGEHEFRTFRTGSKVKIGSIEVEPIHVDHSVPGAYGFLVHTSGGCVAYTGDLRLHGPRSDMTKEFVRRAAAENPIALVCEGTRVSPSDPREDLSEMEVRAKASDLVAGHKNKLAIVSFYPKDVDRMRTFRDVAKATGRKFVVSAKIAHLLESLKDDKRISVPDPMTDPNMLVYVRQDMPRPFPYEKHYIEMRGSSDHVVSSEDVAKRQNQLIFHNDFMQLAELIDILPSPGSLFIRSKSEPFEEDDVQDEVLRNWISYFKLDFHQAHASGHANMEEMFQMIRDIRPKVVIPVHTEHADLFRKCGRAVERPVARKTISLHG